MAEEGLLKSKPRLCFYLPFLVSELTFFGRIGNSSVGQVQRGSAAKLAADWQSGTVVNIKWIFLSVNNQMEPMAWLSISLVV
jgi:hypothetical protein